jgi:hypothetical protein
LVFLALSSSPEQLLHYRPSKQIQRRARALLAKEKTAPFRQQSKKSSMR